MPIVKKNDFVAIRIGRHQFRGPAMHMLACAKQAVFKDGEVKGFVLESQRDHWQFAPYRVRFICTSIMYTLAGQTRYFILTPEVAVSQKIADSVIISLQQDTLIRMIS